MAQANLTPKDYRHELNDKGTACAKDCPACRWSREKHLDTFRPTRFDRLKNFFRHFFSPILVVGCLMSASAAQTTVTGSGVPDADGERMLLIYLSSAAPAGTDSVQTQRIQQAVTLQADITAVTQGSDSFLSQYLTLSNNYNNLPISTDSRQTFISNRDALVASSYNGILNSLSPSGASSFSAYMQSFKSNITTQILGDGSSSYSYLDTLKPYGFLPAGCLDGSNQDCDQFAVPFDWTDGGFLDGSSSPDGCVSVASNINNFTGGNVWETLPTLPNMTFFSLSPTDATLIAGDTNGTLWEYAPLGYYGGADNGWSLLPSNKTMKAVAVGNVNAIYGLDSTGTIFLYQPTTQTWVSYSTSGYSYIAVTHDGILWAAKGNSVYERVNGSYVLKYTDAYTIISLSAATVNSFGTNLERAAWVDSNNAVFRDINGTVTALSLTGLAGKATLVTQNPDGTTYAVDSTQALYSYGASSWTAIPGHKLSYLATASSQSVVGLDATSRGFFSYFGNTVTTTATSSFQDGTNVSFSASITGGAPAGFGFTENDESKVTQYCKAIVTVIFDTFVETQNKFAYERVHYLQPNRSGCNQDGECNHAVEPWCVGEHLANVVDVMDNESNFNINNPYVYWETFTDVITTMSPPLFPSVQVLRVQSASMPKAACTTH